MKNKFVEENTLDNYAIELQNINNFSNNLYLKQNINTKINQIQNYTIYKNDPNCEVYNQISKIVPLKLVTNRYILFILINIISFGLISLIDVWFPKIKIKFYYKKVPIKLATHFCIYSKDNKIEIVKKTVYFLPKTNIDKNNNIITLFNFNINKNFEPENYPTNIIGFEFRLFTYFFSESKNAFEPLNFQLCIENKKFIENYLTGLDELEMLYMKELFGPCDLEIDFNSITDLLLDEISDPFYLFQNYTIIFWYYIGYSIYATIIIIITIISIIMEIYEARMNNKQLIKLARYSCDVKVLRNLYNLDNGKITKRELIINSTELLPGDIFELPENGISMPCDCILVSGNVVVNEAIISGESCPVNKFNLPLNDEILDFNNRENNIHIIYAGSKIIQKTNFDNKKVLGFVYKTGFNTFKGNLIKQIIYPEAQGKKFKKDSLKYVIFMSILCIIGFGISLKFLIKDAKLPISQVIEKFLDFITTCIPPTLPACVNIGIIYSFSRLKQKKLICLNKDAINITGKVKVLVFDKTGTLTEDHLDIKGYIPVTVDENNNFIFDKYMENCNRKSEKVVEYFYDKLKNNKININYKNELMQLYIECLACCHCLTYNEDKKEYIGDPIDIKMFQGINWILEQKTNNNNFLNYIKPKFTVSKNIENDIEKYEINTIKKFDFDSDVKRMTIITKNINENYLKIFCKGAPENIKLICNKETIPHNYEEKLSFYAYQGYRVLSMAAKMINNDVNDMQNIQRDLIENNMIFLGFLIIKNDLKVNTDKYIDIFEQAGLKLIISTGDNLFTSLYVAKKCGLINENQNIYYCITESNEKGEDIIKWIRYNNIQDENENDNENNYIKTENLDNSKINLIKELLIPKKIDVNISNNDINNNINNSIISELKDTSISDNSTKCENDSIIINKKINNNISTKTKNFSSKNYISNNIFKNLSMIHEYESLDNILTKDSNCLLSMTGKIFEKYYILNEIYKKNPINNLKPIHKSFRDILKKCIVFSRMTPQQKLLLIESLKNEKLKTLMCGDGANDCSALKAADIGVSLSEEEASIASHFTSQVNDISCLFHLLKEGKCSLTTSIETFKYIMMYSIIQFCCLVIMMIYKTYLTDTQFLEIDFFIIMPLAWFISRSHPSKNLTSNYPHYNLLSFPVIFSIFLQTLIVVFIQIFGYYILYSKFEWEKKCVHDSYGDPEPCHENSILFIISNNQYLSTGFVFAASKNFREKIYHNWLLLFYLLVILAFNIWIILDDNYFSNDILDLYNFGKDEDIDNSFLLKYILLGIVFINHGLSIFCENVILPFAITMYEKYQMKKHNKEICEFDLKDNNINDNNSEYIYNAKYNNVKEYSLNKYLKVDNFYKRNANISSKKENKKKKHEIRLIGEE